ncbi:MAG: alpha/beta hydrolase [Rhodobacterales bacterium]|jgi:arylformamidase|nr:alpha/beta hydrolase [Rhodobacter sp.]HBN30176.1 alpha/beta hydrolase [Paracoccaceae bacterium]
MTDFDWDDAYSNGKYIAGADDFPPRWAAKALALRTDRITKGRAELDLEYGPHARNKLDILLPDQAPNGLVVIVHGGYWLAFDKSYWSHLAAGALARGYAVALPSYVLAPEVGIDEITLQIKAAVEFAAGRIAGPIHLTGHSAGGHLVTRMLCGDLKWTSCFVERIAKVVSISGLHDLRPLLKTAMNTQLKLDATTAESESALLSATVLPVPTIAWVGGDERPVFIDQSRWLARDWSNAELVVEAGKHHFDVIDGLENPQSALMRALLG